LEEFVLCLGVCVVLLEHVCYDHFGFSYGYVKV
jgi:hypothetical protein